MRLLPSLMVCCLFLGQLAQADEASHRSSAERFLKLANAEDMTAPVYTQVEQLLTARFTQMGGSMQYESVLRDYQRQARDILNAQLSWDAIRDDLIDLYLPVFSEEEFEQLAAFYRSPAGSKLMEHLPELTRDSMAITRERLEQHISPQLEQLVQAMEAEVEGRQAGLR
ncbi:MULTISPECIES: DUF2059 domain-containing protein [Halopseudomonas]|uniref:DUF2059 domain-containing protein n=1 Tax=Halopseudomonas bauzanensis TaxID=653930 RepID=A0A1H9VDH0_9GAMM|nr:MULTISPECIES: DUF2059 domain-containing protein [Halopseudomonas]TKA92488.1 DUF2059 domain-containing protein [Halopseudomonas bauzanensis]WGK62746.1 DUF2059 domain-containing protein [Halopseudomonas sp. SMJS2]SES19840.1 hypothetical protein SAMN05216589_2667 [Halopseudomonas bauzanensis]SFM16126.1 hypothetical protein SAMN04487855_2553 [Halopseudomonas bauzanensis]